MDIIYDYENFVNVVLESTSFDMSKVSKNWIDLYDAYIKICSKYGITPGWLSSGKASGHKGEFARFRFGDDSTFYKMVEELVCVYILQNDAKLFKDNKHLITIEEPQKSISGSYKSIKVTIPKNIIPTFISKRLEKDNGCIDNGDSMQFYITNQTKTSKSGSTGSVGKKMLEPDKIINVSGLFKKNDFVSDVYQGISKSSFSNDIKEALQKILDACIDFGKQNQESNFIDVIEKYSKGVKFEVNGISSDLFTEDDVHNISNDFGEILGPAILMNMLNDCTLKYPTANSKIYDYYITQGDPNEILSYYKISHKSGSGGYPSMLTYFLEIKEKYKDVKDSMDAKMVECFENVIYPMCTYSYVSSLYNVYNKICPEASKTSKFLDDYLFYLNKQKLTFQTTLESGVKGSGVENKNINNAILEKYNEDGEEFIERYKQFLDDIGYRFSMGSKDDAIFLIKEGNIGQRVGTIFVPIELAVKNALQEKYWGLINKLIKEVTSGKQCYSTINFIKSKQVYSIEFKIMNMEDGDYQMRTKGYLTKTSRGLNGFIGAGIISTKK